jgi:hypothetical protein
MQTLLLPSASATAMWCVLLYKLYKMEQLCGKQSLGRASRRLGRFSEDVLELQGRKAGYSRLMSHATELAV